MVGIECLRVIIWGVGVHGEVVVFFAIVGGVGVGCCGPDVEEGSDGVEDRIVEWDGKLVFVDSTVGSVVVLELMI